MTPTTVVSPIVKSTSSVDPFGRCFVSYRRSRSTEIDLLLSHLHENGVPTWHDRANLGSEPTSEAITSTLNDPTTASGLLWLSGDVRDSPIIKQVEASTILENARRGDGFRAHVVLADSLDYPDATIVLDMPGVIEDVSKTWNARKVKENPIGDDDARMVAGVVLRQRLSDIHRALPKGEAVRVKLFAHAKAKAGFEGGYAAMVDWTHHFRHRHASQSAWNTRMLPAAEQLKDSILSCCPGRPIVFEGQATITSAMALGSIFGETTGLGCSWCQPPQNDMWSLASTHDESGFTARLDSADVAATDLAVFINVRGDVRSAVQATSNLPRFRAHLRIAPTDDTPVVLIESPGKAAQLARLIGETLRKARCAHPVIRRTHIFFSGTPGLAMLIGQQLNALGPVQTYEHNQPADAIGHYVPSVLLNQEPALSF